MELIRIPSAGTPGQPGSQPGDYQARALQAPFAKNGEHGMSGSAATAGTDGQNIQLRLHYLDSDPGIVQATGEGVLTARTWKVPHHQEYGKPARL
jgi:hypothetical protein